MDGKILLPLDGSLLAETVIPHAALLARSSGRSLVLLRATECPIYVEGMAEGGRPGVEGWDHDLAEAKQYLETVAARLDLVGLVSATEAVAGYAAPEILAYAAMDPTVELIAMATHGRSGIGRWLLGSVSEKVSQNSELPLLLVRPDLRHDTPGAAQPYRHILVPLDGSASAEIALAPAREQAALSGAPITLLTVLAGEYNRYGEPVLSDRDRAMSEQARGYLDGLAARLRETGQVVSTRLLFGSAADAILSAAEEISPSLIVMATHGRSGIQLLWPGSVALKVAHAATCPLLLVRATPQREYDAARAAAGAAL